MKTFLFVVLLASIWIENAISGPFEDIVGLRFGVSPDEARASVETAGGKTGAKNQKKDEIPITQLPVLGRPCRSANLRFRSDRLAGCFTILQEEAGKPVMQQYRETAQELQNRFGPPTARIGAGIENPIGKDAAKNYSGIIEDIWQLPAGGNPNSALYILLSIGATSNGKSLYVKLNLVSGEFSLPSDLTAILGRIASNSESTPAASPPSAPASPPSQKVLSHSPLSPAKPAKMLVLSPNWESPMQGGSNTLGDLSNLFSAVAKPAINLAADPSIYVYENVPYLTPFKEATKALMINGVPPSRNPVACPGFPRGSFFYYAVDGNFEGHYNRMYVVVDRADQIVSVQLVDETPRERPQLLQSNYEWSTYNFVNARTKAMGKLRIDHQLYAKVGKSGWNIARVEPNATMYRVDSWLLSPGDKYGNQLEPKEQVRWYVPRPIVELILTCAQVGRR